LWAITYLEVRSNGLGYVKTSNIGTNDKVTRGFIVSPQA